MSPVPSGHRWVLKEQWLLWPVDVHHLGRFQRRLLDLQGHPHLAALADEKYIAAESDAQQYLSLSLL